VSARPYILAETNWKTVRETSYEVAVLPWGATEAHNWHLPYATDVIQCHHVAAEAARRAWEAGAKVVVLPTIPFGVNTGQLDIKLTINMNPSTQAAVLRDVVASLDGQGIHKLVLLNGHGGNDFRQMIREIGVAFPTMFICATNWYQVADAAAFFDEPGDHAGELETSMMLHIAPDLVLPLDEAGTGKARRFKMGGLRDGWVWAEREWSKVTEDTGVGDPAKATAEKGARYLDAVAEAIAGFLVELAASDLDDLYEE
jgi:creatinine amidohydrolase